LRRRARAVKLLLGLARVAPVVFSLVQWMQRLP
jgi:hypothetical protein